MGISPCRAKLVDGGQEHHECCVSQEIRLCNAPCGQLQYSHHDAGKPIGLHEMLLCDGKWNRPEHEVYLPSINWRDFGLSDEETEADAPRGSCRGPRIEDSDNQWRKHLFKKNLKMFAHSAVSGTECTIVREDGCVVGKLRLDPMLKKLTLIAEADSDMVLALYRYDLELQDLKGLYRYEMARQLFPELIADLPIPQDDWTRVLVLSHIANGQQNALCLVETDYDARERMIAYLKFLQRRAIKVAKKEAMGGYETSPAAASIVSDEFASPENPHHSLGGRRLQLGDSNCA